MTFSAMATPIEAEAAAYWLTETEADMPNTTALMRDRPKASTSTAPAAPPEARVSMMAPLMPARTLAEITLRASAPPPPMAALALPADTATDAPRTTDRISACWVALSVSLPPPVSMRPPETVASTVLNTLLTATLVPTAMATPAAPACTATAPPMAIAVMLASSLALTVTPALATRRTESSTRARTVVAMLLIATDTPMDAPTPALPADTATPSAPATVTMLPVFAAETRTAP